MIDSYEEDRDQSTVRDEVLEKFANFTRIHSEKLQSVKRSLIVSNKHQTAFAFSPHLMRISSDNADPVSSLNFVRSEHSTIKKIFVGLTFILDEVSIFFIFSPLLIHFGC